MAMTRQHFQAIADVLKENKPPSRNHVVEMARWLTMVESFAKMCKTQNAGFKPDRFYRACGVEDGEL